MSNNGQDGSTKRCSEFSLGFLLVLLPKGDQHCESTAGLYILSTVSTVTLQWMQQSLDEFHANKYVFIELGRCTHFNIPKLHSMLHYIGGIKQLESADGLNSKASECLHIDFAKQAYNRSNGQDFIAQMTIWLQC